MWCLYILAALISALLIFTAPRFGAGRRMQPFTGYKFAHRGLHDNSSPAPENSMAAFGRAVERGYGIELDLQLTADGELVVFHDDMLERVCGESGRMDARSYAELCRMPLYHTEQRIPRFSEVLELVGGRVPLIVELKHQANYTALCQAAAEALHGYKGLYCIESFDPRIVYWFRRCYPAQPRGLLSEDYFRNDGQRFDFALWLCKELFVNIAIRPDFIAYNQLHGSFGLWLWQRLWRAPCVAWTVKSANRERALAGRYDIMIFEGYLSE